jgi:hypothetical protein
VAAPLGRILAGAPAVYLRGVENVLDPAAQSLRRQPAWLPNGRSQIEPIHAWHAERGHLRDDQDQDRVAALEADR